MFVQIFLSIGFYDYALLCTNAKDRQISTTAVAQGRSGCAVRNEWSASVSARRRVGMSIAD
jgi:hypothetical protein